MCPSLLGAFENLQRCRALDADPYPLAFKMEDTDFNAELSFCQSLKTVADDCYRKAEYTSAINQYSAIIDRLRPLQSYPVSGVKDILYIAYSNRCASRVQVHEYQAALDDALFCTELEPSWHKGFVRLGLTLSRLGRLAESVCAYEKAVLLNPGDREARKGLDRVKEMINEENSKHKKEQERNERDQFFARSFSQHQRREETSQNSMTAVEKLWRWLQRCWDRISAVNWLEQLQGLWALANFYWQQLPETARTYIVYGLIAIFVYWYWIASWWSSSYYDDDLNGSWYSRSRSSYGRGYDGYGYGDSRYYADSYYYGGQMSWSMWLTIVAGGYFLPPLFPNQLGPDRAQPFFGMNFTTFLWLLNMFSGRGGGNAFYWNNRRRRPYY